MVIYVVEKGDTLWNVASRYGLDINKIIEINELKYPNDLVVGQTLVLPIENFEYTVQRGDTLWNIARANNVLLRDLLIANPQIIDPGMIMVGQKINIPVGIQKLKDIEVNGYVYPNISMETLRKTLPNLTFLSIFSYDADKDGNLKLIDDERIIAEARRAGVAPVLVVTNYDQSIPGFSSEIANSIFTKPEAKQNLFNEIITTALTKGYKGVSIDFEYLNPNDKDNFVQFLRELKEEVSRVGLQLWVNLAPKLSENQQGILYEAHDYERIGSIADRIILMTYEWGYLYGEPQAVSPILPITQVLDYATSVIDPQKILLGVSNYGYDWTLPWQKGTPAELLTNVGAVDLAREKGSFIEYDETAQAPYFTYQSQTNEHIAWFEDARSIYSRLKLVDKYNLRGISYWTLNNYFPQSFLVQNALYGTIKL